MPFTVTIPEHERDPKLTAKLAEELPGILAWAVRGCLAWREHGLGLPAEVRAATATYKEEMDLFGGFLDDGCVAEDGAFVTARDLYAAYQAWAEANGEKARSQKALGVGLRERGFESSQGAKGVRRWRGLRLRREGEDGPGSGLRVADGCASSRYFDHRGEGDHGAQARCEVVSNLVEDARDAHPRATRNPDAAQRQIPVHWEEGEL